MKNKINIHSERANLFLENIAKLKAELIAYLKDFAKENGEEGEILFDDAGIFIQKSDICSENMVLSFNSEGSIDVGERNCKILENLSVDLLSLIYTLVTKDGKTWLQLVNEFEETIDEEV